MSSIKTTDDRYGFTLQDNIEITDQQKNIVNLIVELLDC